MRLKNIRNESKSLDNWVEVDSKSVFDLDGFVTDYTWYTDGDKHIFMFGDKDIEEPDEDYADWECDSEEEAREWFDNYDSDYYDDDDDYYYESITQANISEYPIEFDYRYETDDIMDFFKGFITVKAHNEEEAINKAKKYLNSSEYLNKHINHYDPTNIKISDTFYKNVDVVEGASNVNENRRIELAKKLLEGEGYRIRKKSLNEVSAKSDFIDPMKVVISIKPKEDDDYHMQQAMNFFNKNIHTWKLSPEVLTDNGDGIYQLCFPGLDDWMNKIKLHCEESILDIQIESLT